MSSPSTSTASQNTDRTKPNIGTPRSAIDDLKQSYPSSNPQESSTPSQGGLCIENLVITDPPSIETKKYDVFRKKFHVPYLWLNDEKMIRLLEYNYQTHNMIDAFSYIYEIFKKLGYDDDKNKRMLHDYIHFMICDLLTFKKIPFLTENEIKKNEVIFKFLNNTTPDLLMKGSKLIDIYVGDKDPNDIKSKYKKFEKIFEFKVVTPFNMTNELSSIFEQAEIDYLYKNYQIFKTEYYYWISCIKMQKILRNEHENIKIKFALNKEDVDQSLPSKIEYQETVIKALYQIISAQEKL